MPTVQDLVKTASETVAPYLAIGAKVFQSSVAVPFQSYVNSPLLVPLATAVSTQLAPVVPYIEAAQNSLPSLKGYPVNYIGIAVIAAHVCLYNAIAQVEYRSKIFTKVR